MRLFLFFILIFSSLFAEVNIKGGEGNILFLDSNSTLYWKGKYLTGYNQYHTSDGVEKILNKINKFEVGRGTFFAIDNSGNLYGWGYNLSSSDWVSLIGNGNGSLIDNPVKIDLKEPVIDISTDGNTHTLAVTKSGYVYAWGDSLDGDLGILNADSTYVPLKIKNLSNIKAVSAGTWFSLALDNDGNVYSWGRNYYGQLGLGDRSKRETPQKISSLTNVTQIVAGSDYALALTDDGKVDGWGNNAHNIFGNNSEFLTTPEAINNLKDILLISSNGYHVMALDKDGNLYSWGANSSGEVGDGTTQDVDIPKKLPLKNVIDIATGDGFSLALAKDGVLYGWGKKIKNFIDNNESNEFLTPTQINLPVKLKTDFKKLETERTTLQIHKGWNLIGFPVNKTITPKNYFKNYLIWRYDEGKWLADSDIYDTKSYTHLEKVKPGQAFWIYLENNSSINMDKLDFDLNQTDAFKASLGWAMFSSSKDGNVTELLEDKLRSINDRKIVWKYDNNWSYYARDENISKLINGKYNEFNGFVKSGEGFWVFTTGYIYDYRYFEGSDQYPSRYYNKDKDVTQIATDRMGVLSVFEIENNRIKNIKKCIVGGIRDYKFSDDGKYIYASSDSNLVILQNNDDNLTKLSKYESDGYIWSLKYLDSKVLLQHDNEIEVINVSNSTNPSKIVSLSGYKSKIFKNYIVVASNEDNNYYLNIFDRNSLKLLKKIYTTKGNMVDFNNIINENSTLIAGYNGYENYPDQKTYSSGMIIADFENNTSNKKISFGDVSKFPFAIEDGKIYTTYNDGYSGGLRVINENNATLYSYNFPTHINSIELTKITKSGYIIMITERNDGKYLSVFDKKLKFLDEIKIEDFKLYLASEENNGSIVLFSERLSDEPMIYIFKIVDNKIKLQKKKKLDRFSYFIKKKDSNTAFIIDGKRFEVIDLDRFSKNVL